MPTARKKSNQSRTKTKTFSGCWTCRDRKVKCDLVQPNCRRCQQADLKCSGYGLELYWITGAERVAASAIKRRARKVTFPGWQFDLNAVDAQLADIDDLPIGNILDGQSRGAFAVFRGDNTDAFESICISNQLPQECTDTHSETPYESIEDFEATESVLEKSTTELADPAQNADELGLMPLVRQSRLTTALPHLPLYMNFGRTCFDDPLISSLLSHYINDVCVLLTPLDHPNNPYSSIHFPKALVGATELDPSWSYTSHSTSSTSIAVFYAVMATAAFHLSSKNGPDSRALYLTGRSYRAKALSSIRKALQSSLGPDRGTPLTIQQCEAILSAMFALVTLDVVEGSMSEFWIHLDGIAQMRRKWQIESPEIDRLMSIHSFLTTVARSTSMPQSTDSWSGTVELPMLHRDSIWTSDGLIFTYGISKTLLSIMQCMVTLSEHLAHCFQESCDPPQPLLIACEEVYSTLLQWFTRSEAMLYASVDEEDPVQLLRARYNLLAFAHALKVYYHTRLISCSAMEMRVCVREVAHCLTQIELLKADGGSGTNFGATVSWPGFIASCESEPGRQREVWYVWWGEMIKYGIGNIAGLWKVVQEAWRLKDEGGTETPAWMPVLREGGFRILAV